MIIERDMYLTNMNGFLGKPFIKVLTGQRRVGKSTLLRQFFSHVPEQQKIFLDFEQKVNDPLHDEEYAYQTLKQYVLSGVGYLILDEVQHISGWERVVLSLFSEFSALEIRLTGSNSTLLSSSLTTLLRGRYIELHIYPFLFDEFCVYYSLPNTQESFLQYMEIGGFPGTYRFDTYEEKQSLVQQIINTVLLNDVIEKYAIRDIKTLQDVVAFFINNMGNITNSRRIREYIEQYGSGIAHVTLQQYISYLEASYLLYPVELYDIQGKKVFDRLRKWYISDHSRRKYMFGSFDPGYDKALENIVFMTCRRAGREVKVGRVGDIEVDFIIEKQGNKKYLQVAYLLTDEKVVEREFRNLLTIPDNYEKRVVSLDPLSLGQLQGVRHTQLWNFATDILT